MAEAEALMDALQVLLPLLLLLLANLLTTLLLEGVVAVAAAARKLDSQQNSRTLFERGGA